MWLQFRKLHLHSSKTAVLEVRALSSPVQLSSLLT